MALSLDADDPVAADSGAAGRPRLRVGLVGQGIGPSRTPAMHEAEGAAHGLDYRYRLLDPAAMAPSPDLGELLDAAERAGYAGLNVTYPYKTAVIDLLDELSDAARMVGAVNTVVFRDGRRRGHNTDFWGFAESVRRFLPDAPLDDVLLVGAGGAGAAVAHALRTLGVRRLLIADAEPQVAERLVDRVSAAAGAALARPVTDMAAAAADVNGIVNATPVGMAKLPGTAIEPDLLAPRHWVADIVYFPLETELLRAARARGCRCLDGSGMAVFQAVRAFELFTGLTPDSDRMRATFEALSG
ncbi:shikimate dehydrogenase [Marinibaculum pumilum]|uniref:Shikimate dehydrogenase (NADP(+)) n=1 Tax=Marinibaculum pumilum TaxID=1766165 RepID=A0ABV7L031_9PROT